MRPAILRQCAHGEDKAVYLFIERTRMIGNSKTDIGRVICLNQVPLCLCVLDYHMRRPTGRCARFLDIGPGNCDFAVWLERLYPCSFVRLDCGMSPSNVGPIIRGKPANGEAVDKYMRL